MISCVSLQVTIKQSVLTECLLVEQSNNIGGSQLTKHSASRRLGGCDMFLLQLLFNHTKTTQNPRVCDLPTLQAEHPLTGSTRRAAAHRAAVRMVYQRRLTRSPWPFWGTAVASVVALLVMGVRDPQGS